jgi:hypothetical protein
VYYNKLLGRWVLDAVDILLLSALAGSFLGSHMRDYTSEEAKMERLKRDIIAQSPLINASEPKKERFLKKDEKERLEKIYRFALSRDVRGGDLENEFNEQQWKERVAILMHDAVTQLLAKLKTNELKYPVLKVLFYNVRVIIQNLLMRYGIILTYAILERVPPHVAVIAYCVGGTAGFISGWFKVAIAGMSIPSSILLVFLLKGLYQQTKILRQENELNTDLRQHIEQLKEDIDQLTGRGEPSNQNRISKLIQDKVDSKIEHLKEPFGMSDTVTRVPDEVLLDSNGKVESINSLKPELKPENRFKKPAFKNRREGKTMKFSEFVEQFANETDSNIIEPEIIKNETREPPIRIRIPDQDP